MIPEARLHRKQAYLGLMLHLLRLSNWSEIIHKNSCYTFFGANISPLRSQSMSMIRQYGNNTKCIFSFQGRRNQGRSQCNGSLFLWRHKPATHPNMFWTNPTRSRWTGGGQRSQRKPKNFLKKTFVPAKASNATVDIAMTPLFYGNSKVVTSKGCTWLTDIQRDS